MSDSPTVVTYAATDPERARARWFSRLAGPALVVLTLAAYATAVRNGFIWDDDKYLYQTQWDHVAAPDALHKIWLTTATPQYYPLVFTSYWIQYRLGAQFDPTAYHVVNILLHALAAVLAWRILRRLEVPGAWVIAAIFAVHPVHVETVDWITERKNTLSAFFYMIALLAYLRFTDRSNLAWYALALVAFILALLSKTVVCSLPVVILLLLWLRKKVRWPAVVGLVPFLLAGLFMARITGWWEFHKNEAAYWEPMPIGKAIRLAWIDEWNVKSRSGYGIEPPQRILMASRALIHYARTLAVPYPLAFYYGDRWDLSHKPDANPTLDPRVPQNWIPVGSVLAALILLVALGVQFHRGILVGTAFFIITLFPALGFVDFWPMRFSYVADHFQYLASFGPIALVVAGIAVLLRRYGGRPVPEWGGVTIPAVSLSIVVIVVLGVATAVRATAFRNEETLYLDTIKKTPSAYAAYINLSGYYARHGRYGEAAEIARQLIDREPTQFAAYDNLGNALFLAKRYAEAEAVFQSYISRVPRPTPDLYIRLAGTQKAQDKYDAASATYEQAVARFPKMDRLYRDWAAVLERLGNKTASAEKLAVAQALAAGKAPPSGVQPPSIAKVDLGNAKTPQDRRKAYADLIDLAIARRDYNEAMRVVQAFYSEFRTSVWMYRRLCMLNAASPIPYHRNGKQAVMLGENLRASQTGHGRLESEDLEVLAAAYAEVGRFPEAVTVVDEAIKLASGPHQAGDRARLQQQKTLYQANKPYRMPEPIANAPPAPTGAMPTTATAPAPRGARRDTQPAL